MDEQVLLCPVCGHQNPPEARFCQNDGVALQEGDIDDPLVGRLVGNYRLKERIGEGGFGVVYLAEHREMHAHYAVKILHPQFSANAHVAERFRREAAAAGRLRHENVVHIADFGQAQGVGYYYVMEFLQGKTLKDALDQEEPFPPERVLHIAQQVTSAMERVHELNIIHRDLKPENIFLITKNNQQDHVKLVDFGIAKVMDGGASITRTGLSVGTPLYMSPEQARGLLKELDRRSDIYSWGIILFELLTYQPPFFSENPHDVVMLQIRATPPRLSDTHPYRRFSEPIEDFFRRVLAKRSDQRPSTMTALYEELEPLLLAPDAFHDVISAEEFHAGTPVPEETIVRGTAPEVISALGQDDLFDPENDYYPVNHEEGTSIDVLPALHHDDSDEATELYNSNPNMVVSPEVTAIAPNPHLQSLDDNAAHQEGELLTDESAGASPFVGAPPAEGPKKSDSLDGIFDGIGLPEESGEVVANARRGVSVGDTSEALWGTATGSMATDPNALQSPIQRYWWAFAVLFVLCLGVIFWVTKEPAKPQKKEPSLASFGKKPAARVDAGTAAVRTAPPSVRRADAGASRPEMATPRPAPRIPDIRPLPTPRPVRTPPKKRQRYRLLLRSRPRAACYVGPPGSKRKFIGRTPCKIRAFTAETVYIRLSRRGYRPVVRLWSVGEEDEDWMLTLRKRRSRRAIKRQPPPRRVKRRPPPPRRRDGSDVFNQTPNPFAKKKKQ